MIAKYSLLALPVILLAACNRDTPPPATQAGASPDVQNNSNDNDSMEGRLAFRIQAIYQNQEPAEDFPGHVDGGTWTFLDCLAGDVPFVIGFETNPPSAPGLPPEVEETLTASAVRGRAVLRVPDNAASRQFLDTFAYAFHTTVPAPLTVRPVHPVIFNTVSLGTGLQRASNGRTLEPAPAGTWASARWLVSTPRLSAELLFNIDLANKQGEFVEKDPGSQEDLITLWSRILRDGPRGLRTPLEDRNIVNVGPHAGALTQVAGPEAFRPFFVPGNKWLVYTAIQRGKPAQVWEVELAHPDNRRLVAEVQEVYQVQCVDPEGRYVLVEEKIPDVPGTVSSADPSRFLWIDAEAGTTRTLGGPWKSRDVDLPDDALSPDSHYLVISESRTRADGKGGFTELYIVNLQGTSAVSLDINNQYLETAGWMIAGDALRLTARTGLKVNSPADRAACLIDPATGEWVAASPQQVPPPIPDMLVSPDNQNAAEVIDHQKLLIHRDRGTHELIRQLDFNPEDRIFAELNSLTWLDTQYMSFFNPYPIIINTSNMKMNYFLQTDRAPRDIRYSTDFKFAAIVTDEGLFVAPVLPGRI